MTILFDINHPSHVHTFKNIIKEFGQKGIICLVTARKKEMTHQLLVGYAIPYISTGKTPISRIGKVFKGIITIFHQIYIIQYHKPDLVISMESPYAVLAAYICRVKSLTLADTETSGTIHKIISPLSSLLLVPACFNNKISRRQIYFSGFKELAYLHPTRFNLSDQPNDSSYILKQKPYAIIRFVAFNALHDKGHSGFSIENKLRLVKALLKYMDIYISSEVPLNNNIQQYQLQTPVTRIHQILANASLYVGESMTMAAEAAILGVPSICLNDMELGYINELSQQYDLIYKFSASETDQFAAINKAIEVVKETHLKHEWQLRRWRMLADKIDVTAFLVWVIQNYPASIRIMRDDPDYQYNFK